MRKIRDFFVATHRNYLAGLGRDSIQSFIMIVCLDTGILRVKKLSRSSHIIESIACLNIDLDYGYSYEYCVRTEVEGLW